MEAIELDQILSTPKTASAVEYAVDIVGLEKSFRRQTLRSGYTTLKSSFMSLLFGTNGTRTHEVTRAIKHLTLRIPRGASVGVIGRNGAGKSTFLKLLTGIYKPDCGKVAVNGRIAALIELGAGFHPDFTGRENLHLAGIMHGLSRAQIEARLDDIVDFAELRHVIDDPVRTYSSGMYMRLGFSIAIHTDPDVLLVDEVLSVGDAAFVAKCRDRISDLRKAGKTLVFVTHDLGAVERWCDEAIWLDAGEVKDRGHPRRVIDHYREFLEHGEEQVLQATGAHPAQASAEATTETQEISAYERWGSREVEIGSVRMLNNEGNAQLVFHPDDAVRVEIQYSCHEVPKELVFGICINRSDGLVVHGSNTDIERIKVTPQKSTTVFYKIKRLGLLEGSYSLDVAAHRQDGYAYDYHKSALKFAVRSPLKQIGVMVPEHSWEV